MMFLHNPWQFELFMLEGIFIFFLSHQPPQLSKRIDDYNFFFLIWEEWRNEKA
jgi:hypothetical protein